MHSYHQGPLKNIHQALRAALPPHANTDLPNALGTNTPCGRIAREVLSSQGTQERLALGELCSEKLKNRAFISRLENREAVKVVLQEVSIFTSVTAQELGLSFASALNRSDDTWLRIIAGLEVAELLSRLHIYAPASTAAYRQLYDCFDAYMRTKGFEKGPIHSLFHPIATAGGDPAIARTHAIEAVLQYGEEALRLLWGLQARATRDGQTCRAEFFRAEETQLATKFVSWSKDLATAHYVHSQSWFRSLQAALEISHRGEGPASVFPRETARSIAVRKLLDDVQSLVKKGDNELANRHATSIHRGLTHVGDLSDSPLQDSYLLAAYIRTLVTYRIATQAAHPPCESESRLQAKTRNLWQESERIFHEPGTLWSRAVTDARATALTEVPLLWRVTPPQLPI